MEVKGSITMLVGSESTTIEIMDDNSNTTFVSIELTPDQLSACLSRQGRVKCDLDIRGIERVGKKHEWKTFEFKVPSNYDRFNSKCSDLANHVYELLSNEWKCDHYFKSQTSFFNKDGELWGRATIRRYV
ncbi:MAG: hypothetical protein [Caudoviricetes sp.]|nr:MAG: hypothetical protein [Caudoviricetes sp.]